MSLFPDPETRRAVLLALCVVLALLALAMPWVDRRASRLAARLHLGALAAAAVLGFLAYTSQNWASGRYFNPYEFFHYYVGGKYLPELGYTRLYDAAVLVDRETAFPHRARDVANLSAHLGGPEYKPVQAVYAEEEAIRAPFTPERWAELVHDVTYFRDRMSPGLWVQLQHDKGYNPTPVWTMLGGTLATWVPAELAPRLLMPLDVLLLLGAFALVGWAFGARAALLSFALYVTHYCTGHSHFRAAFLRTDWLFALVASVCLLRKRYPAAAGVLLAWSALLRIFPVVFALGPLAVVAWCLLRRDDPRRRDALRFLAGLAGGGVLLLGASVLHGGVEPWSEFAAKIAEHDQRPASDTIGFKKPFLWTVQYQQGQGPEIRAAFDERKPVWWTLQVLFAAGLAWLVRRRSLEAALGLSFVMVWCLTTPAYYYYAFLQVPLLYFLARRDPWARAVGVAAVFATGALAWSLHRPNFGDYFAFKFSLVIGGLCAVMVAHAWLVGRRRTTSEAGDATVAAR